MQTIADARAELWRYRLPKPVGGSGVAAVDVLVVSLETTGGETGLGFSYVLGGRDDLPLPAAREIIARFITGQSLDHPIALWRRIAASFNRTGDGPYATALAAIDVAVWDVYAKRLGVPLGVAMGGASRSVPVYGSGEFYAHQDPAEAAAVAIAHRERGLRAVKPRAAGTPADAEVLDAVARAAGPAIAIMVDANEKCTLASASRLLRAAAGVDALFVEEPLPSAQLAGYRTLARTSPVPIATGEHQRSPAEAAPYIIEGLCAVIQPDLAAMGGLTPCLRTAQLAEHANVDVAPHFLPGLFVHVAAAAPNVTWLEDFPVLEPLFTGWPPIVAGCMSLDDITGHGLALAEGARETYRIGSS